MSEALVFISHATTDADYARAFAGYIKHTISGVRTFEASDPASISSGGDWFFEILQYLADADALVVIYSKNSRNRMWVGFELGYSWKKLDGKKIHCVYDPEVQLPSPLNEKQAKDMTDISSLQAFFVGLAQDLDLEYENDYDRLPSIIESLPVYDPFSVWKTYLSRWEGWDAQEIRNDERSNRQWTYLDDPKYQIVAIFNDWKEYDQLPWAKHKGLNTDGSNPQLGYDVNFNISGITIKQAQFYSWDNSRYFVPKPGYCEIDPDDLDSKYWYCYDGKSLDFLAGMMIGDFSHSRNLVEFARRCSIRVVNYP